jgi:DNA-directed RNA polymerase subunit RPC12/RpoP
MTNFCDQELVCRDCGATFTFTAGEQAFFAEKQFTSPIRCKACRQARKAAKDGGQTAHQLGNFNNSDGYPQDLSGFTPPPVESRKRSGSRRRRVVDEEQDW